MPRYIFAVLLLVFPLQVHAVNKCMDNGKIAYQDAPCPNEGIMLSDIHPETETEKIRREQDAAVVTHNLGDGVALAKSAGANGTVRSRSERQRQSMRYANAAPAAGYRNAHHRRAGMARMHKKQRAIKNRLQKLHGF